MFHPYQHSFFVDDLDWFPNWEHVDALHNVLKKWGLVHTSPTLIVIDGKVPFTILKNRSEIFPENLSMSYPASDPVAARKLGFPQALLEIRAVMGFDYRLVRGINVQTKVARPPRDGDVVLERRSRHDESNPTFGMYDSFWGSANSSHPVTELITEEKVPSKFSGVWRSGLCLTPEGGKWPRWTAKQKAPIEEFRIDLEAALGTSVVEFGVVI